MMSDFIGNWKIGVYRYSDDNWNLGKSSGNNGSAYLAGVGDLGLRCALGTGPVIVSWAGTLDVACSSALTNVTALQMTSFRGQGETWGKINMSTNSTVWTFVLDDKLQKLGTYGASGSGAEFIDDLLFSGPGVLKVRKGSGGTRLYLR